MLIACHGSTFGDLRSSDGKRIRLQDLQDIVNNEACPAFRNAPKVFVVLACRGEKDMGDFGDTDTNSILDEVRETIWNNTAADFFTIFSTVEGFVSYRDTLGGTYFLRSMCDVWRSDFFTLNIHDLMTKVKFIFMRGYL